MAARRIQRIASGLVDFTEHRDLIAESGLEQNVHLGIDDEASLLEELADFLLRGRQGQVAHLHRTDQGKADRADLRYACLEGQIRILEHRDLEDVPGADVVLELHGRRRLRVGGSHRQAQ